MGSIPHLRPLDVVWQDKDDDKDDDKDEVEPSIESEGIQMSFSRRRLQNHDGRGISGRTLLSETSRESNPFFGSRQKVRLR